MKFPITEDFEEEFTSPGNKKKHYNKRQRQGQYLNITADEYEDVADKLSRDKIDNKNIFGYISITRDNKTAYCKYNKATEDFVVYTLRNNEPYTITMYKKDWRQYNADKAIEYFDEIPE